MSLGNKITQIARMGPGWEIYFEWFHVYYSSWTWLLIGYKKDETEVGAWGFPGIWLLKNKISSYFRLGSQKMKGYSQIVQSNKWQSYKMSSYWKEDNVNEIIFSSSSHLQNFSTYIFRHT